MWFQLYVCLYGGEKDLKNFRIERKPQRRCGRGLSLGLCGGPVVIVPIIKKKCSMELGSGHVAVLYFLITLARVFV